MNCIDKIEIAKKLQNHHYFFRAFWDIGEIDVTDSSELPTAAIYFDEKGNVILTIVDFDKETCNIKDAKGVVIGNVHKSLKGVACVLHCFQNQMDMKTHSKH
jgi:hypothetical protein